MSSHLKSEHKVPLHIDFYGKEYNGIRRGKLILLFAMFNKYPQFAELDQSRKTDIIKQIEEACCVYTKEKAFDADLIFSWDSTQSVDIYHSICYRITSNLDIDLVRNDALCNRVLSGEISYVALPRLSSQDIDPAQYSDIMEKMYKSKHVSTAVKTSSLYRCGRCKQNKCLIETIQNRSLDEGASVKVTCANCGNWWFS